MMATKGFQTLVIGDGPDRKLVRGGVTGFVQNVGVYLQKIDILLFPTHHHEGISMAILEAMSCGIPVLATDIGGNREIITSGYNGYLYKQGDAIVMARDIRELKENQIKLRFMGKHAREVISKKFDIKKQAMAFADFFMNI